MVLLKSHLPCEVFLCPSRGERHQEHRRMRQHPLGHAEEGKWAGLGDNMMFRGSGEHVSPSHVALQVLLNMGGQECHLVLPNLSFFCRELPEVHIFGVNLVGSSIQLKMKIKKPLSVSNKTCLQSRCGPQATLESLEQSLDYYNFKTFQLFGPFSVNKATEACWYWKGRKERSGASQVNEALTILSHLNSRDGETEGMDVPGKLGSVPRKEGTRIEMWKEKCVRGKVACSHAGGVLGKGSLWADP